MPHLPTHAPALAGNDTALAKSQYEAAMKRFILATTRNIRELRPGCVLCWENYPIAPGDAASIDRRLDAVLRGAPVHMPVLQRAR
jgi:hypothetical protein